MALPTAQLGALGNMSMPYSIPTYDKGPNIWEKALASFIVNAAGGVATKAADNVMSRDYAKEFGEDKAGGWSKLVNGPKVDAGDAKMRRQQAFTADQNQMEIDARAGQTDADAANARLRLDQQGQQGMDEQQLRDMNALLRGDRDIAAQQTHDRGAIQARANEDFYQQQGREALLKEEYRLKGQMPDQQLNQTIVDRMKNRGSVGAGASATPAVNPNIAAFAQGGAGAAPAGPRDYGAPPEQQFVSNADDVANMLASGRSPEEILAIVQRQQQVSAAAQALPPSRSGPSAAIQPELQSLLQQLGLTNQPLTSSPRGRDY